MAVQLVTWLEDYAINKIGKAVHNDSSDGAYREQDTDDTCLDSPKARRTDSASERGADSVRCRRCECQDEA
eukprot:20343-Eustigmatos_ZCMA.PRE.1